MNSKFFLAIGIILILAFGTLAAFKANDSSPPKTEIQKELIVNLHKGGLEIST